jgi:glycosyltransferase involved in cell wall biosynthesis
LHVPPTDWVKTDDAKIGAFCQTFFDEGQFDLIHLHAVQVLTASVADAAQACAIPYVITLHDAWWLSPYLFLVDEQGGAVNPRDLLSGGTPTATEKTQRATRHHRLHQIMGKSAALLAVSHSFADVYRQAGVSAVQTHENISEVFEALPRMQDGDHRTVLGFVGGMSRHKGYHLLQEALETGHYPEFRCVVVDHGMEPGEASYTSQWGQTEIEFIPKIKQNAVANLYSRLDVLIAPSIWPESFGLVTREAAHAGLWVIASDRGAIGDCVQEGINGNIIAVDDCTGLMRALDALKPGRARRASDAPVATALAPAPAQMETYVEKLSAVYQRAIDHNPQQSTSTSAIRASTGHPKPNTRRKH